MALEITKEMFAAAKTYMPLLSKIELSKIIAEKSVGRVNVARDNPMYEEIHKLFPLPSLESELYGMKIILTLNVILAYYFGIDIKTDEKGEISEAIYDSYAESHILNQIDRFKSDASLRNKAFDILSDIKEFKKMIDTEIYNLRMIRNDPLARLISGLSVSLTKENLEKIKSTLAQAQEAESSQEKEND